MRRQLLCTLLLSVCAASVPVCVRAQNGSTEASALTRTHSLYFQRDYEGACEAARSALPLKGGAPALRAWYAVALSRAGRELQAVAVVDSLSRTQPSSAWTLFARAMVGSTILTDKDSTLALARRAYEGRRADPDFAWMYASLLQRYGEYTWAAAFVDSVSARTRPTAELLAMKGYALGTWGHYPKHDSFAYPRAIEAFRQAQALDSTNVHAFYLEAQVLSDTLGDSIAVAHLRRAAELAPYSPSVVEDYWSAVDDSKRLSADEKHRIIAADVDRVARDRGDTPVGEYLMVTGYDDLKDTTRRAAALRRLEAQFANTPQAEDLAYQSLLQLNDSLNKKLVDSADGDRRLRDGWFAFVKRPAHFGWGHLGSAYVNSYLRMSGDTTATVAQVFPLMQGAARYSSYNAQIVNVMMPVYLADHLAHLTYAEKQVREGEYRVRAEMKGFVGMSVADLANMLDGALAQERDALGWVLYAEGKKAQSSRAFADALRHSKKNPSVYYHLGRIAEWEGKADSAQSLYAKGMQYESTGLRGSHRNRDALKRVYTSRGGGSLAAFDAYVARLGEQERKDRHARILADRIKDPKPAPRFALTSLTGARVTSDSLKGRIAVVNFWGTWCGPCILEAGDIQKFYDRYRKDTSVVFVTISNDQKPEVVRDFMTKRHFDFPVLMDSGYVRQAEINSWPTTWFIDREGRIAFSNKGASDVVAEEFTWRVEALKERPTP